ncbi:MAG TPA: hypothetical protein VGN52_18495 [Burkholderiales bacterium]
MSEIQNSPYAPPRAAVEDHAGGPAPARPPVVDRAVKILWIGFGIGVLSTLYNLVFPMAVQKASPLALTLALAAVGYAVSIWIYLAIGSGRNWARILYFIFTVFSLIGLLYTFVVFRMFGGVRVAFALVGTLLHCYVAYLLLTEQAREWYRAVKEAR